MKWRWLGGLAKLAVTVVTVSMLTILTAGYVVNTYIQSLLGSFNLPITGQAPTLGGMVKGMLGFGGGNETDRNGNAASKSGDDPAKTVAEQGTAETTEPGVADADNGSGETTDNGLDGAAAADGTGGSGSEEETPPEDALAVMGGGISSGGASSGGQEALGQDREVIVTPDEMVAKKDGLSDQEKEKVFAMLMSKLPSEEMQKMTEAMEDGLTEAEMIEIEQILSKYLSKTEYADILKILKS
ncbi:hypothetical protein V3851_11750 [Paenibacillus sp. M1]|uniref:Uncharacterized protein n=1 Tax=Paenibacillus haidiansis TaxID=1574488 RepID=A0ABU7VS00_9BACL